MTPDKLVVRTAVLAAPGKLEFRTDELATGGLGPRDIVAVTRTSVISPGTEVGAFVGLPPLRPGVTYPRLVGYCNLAEVIAAGPEVKHAAVGKRILTFESHRSAFRAAEDTVVAVVSDDVTPHGPRRRTSITSATRRCCAPTSGPARRWRSWAWARWAWRRWRSRPPRARA